MRKTILFIFVMSIFFNGCKREYGSLYDPPKGQQGNIYKQLASDSIFSTFVSAIDKVPGLKDELSSSGLFTIMAPDNEAFRKYFKNNPTFKSIEVIPADTLSLIVKFHIMKWMLFKVNFLNPGLTKDNFKAYKYVTRANFVFTDQTIGGGKKAIYYPSKMLQVYTSNFFSLYYVTAQDYTDVFGSESSIATESQMNVMGARVKYFDIASGNGVIHVIDKVLIPPPTVAQLLETNSEYSVFSQLMKNRFLTYSYNSSATNAQGNHGDINGDGLVDSLWNRKYSFTSIDFIDNENPISSDLKTSLTMTAFVPSKTAFLNYLNNKLTPGFSNNIDSIPTRTLKLFYQSCFSQNMYWPSGINAGNVTNLLGDKVVLSRSDISKIKMASNGLFYELNKVNEPDAFTTVVGPAFLSSEYWYFAEMLVQTEMLSSLTTAGAKYTLFCPTNQAFNNCGIYWDPTPGSNYKPGFFRKVGSTISQLSIKQLTPLVGNHILFNKELSVGEIIDGFYPTLNNSIIVVENGKMHGSVRDTIPQIIDPNKHMNNGYFQGINKTIMDPQESIYDIINSASAYNNVPPLVRPEFTKFKELCRAAGILSKDFISITQVDADKKFSLFVPSNEVITAAQMAGILPKTGAVIPNEPTVSTSDLSIKDLVKKAKLEAYIRYFFIRDQQIFTDGKNTGTFINSRIISLPGFEIQYMTSSITYQGNILTLNEIGTSTIGKVLKNNPLLYPQNTIAKDGVIQIIDNAFMSKY